MSAEWMDERDTGLERLSERLFGEAEEVESAEAEILLKTAGIDPDRLKGTLYQRMRERSDEYSAAGRPQPPLLQQALEDLRPFSDWSESESAITRTARLAVARLLQEIRELPKLLNAGTNPVFMAAYRNRKELSTRDKDILDEVAEDLRRDAKAPKTHE